MSGAEKPAAEREPCVWSVYVVRRGDGALYTGIATDVERRLAEHRDGRGAKALRGRGPLALVARLAVGERGLALRVEGRLKRLPKAAKEALVARRGRLRRLVAEEEAAGSPGGAPDPGR